MSDFKDKPINQLAIECHTLWEGCILASCVHGVMLAEYPFTIDENRWSGGIYVMENGEGGKAALVFSDDDEHELMFGMVCDFMSQRTDLVLTEEYSQSHYQGAPEDIQEMAEALSILFQVQAEEENLPFVTTGFWGEGGQIFSHDNYEDWFLHGGHVLEPLLMPFEDAMSYYQVKCSMDAPRMEIAERIYRERIKSPKEIVVLKKEEIAVLEATGPYNMPVCQDIFGQFGIVFEGETKGET